MEPNDCSRPKALSVGDERRECRKEDELPSNVFLNEIFSPESDTTHRYLRPWLRNDWASPGQKKSPFDFQKFQENQTENYRKPHSEPISLLAENQRNSVLWMQTKQDNISDNVLQLPFKEVKKSRGNTRPPRVGERDFSQRRNNDVPQKAIEKVFLNDHDNIKTNQMWSSFNPQLQYTPPEIHVHHRRSYNQQSQRTVSQEYYPSKHQDSYYERPFPLPIDPKRSQMYLSRTSHIEPYADTLHQPPRRRNEWHHHPESYRKHPPVPKTDLWETPSEEQKPAEIPLQLANRTNSELSEHSWPHPPKRPNRKHDDSFQSEVKKAWDSLQMSKKESRRISAGSSDYSVCSEGRERKSKQRFQTCAGCNLTRTASLFSATQLKKRKDKRKCLVCLGEKCSMCDMQLANVCFPLPAHFNVKYFPGQLLPGGKKLSEDERQELKCIFCMFCGKPELDWPRTFLTPKEMIERYISSLRAKYGNVLQKIARIYQSALENLTQWPFLLKHWRSDSGDPWMIGRLKIFLISPKTLESTIMTFLRKNDYLAYVEDISTTILSRQMPRTLKEKMLLVMYKKVQKLPKKLKMHYKRPCKEHIVSNYLREGFEEADDLIKKELPCVLDNVIAQLCEFLTLEF